MAVYADSTRKDSSNDASFRKFISTYKDESEQNVDKNEKDQEYIRGGSTLLLQTGMVGKYAHHILIVIHQSNNKRRSDMIRLHMTNYLLHGLQKALLHGLRSTRTLSKPLAPPASNSLFLLSLRI